MITSTMSAVEVVHDALQDRPSLLRKVKPISAKLEHKHRKERDKKFIFRTFMDWRSPRGNNWLIVLNTSKHETSIGAMVWYRGKDGRLRAMQMKLQCNDAIEYSAHVLERYMERFDPGRDPIQRLRDFFFENHNIVVQPLHDLGDGHAEVLAGLYHGLATGDHDSTTGITTLTTFLDHGMLGPDQQLMAEHLDFQRELQTYSKGFREHVLRLIAEEKKKGV